jgi:hypothetical protein
VTAHDSGERATALQQECHNPGLGLSEQAVSAQLLVVCASLTTINLMLAFSLFG